MDILKKPTNIKKQAGDTLVEVLISIAIVSVVITGAYALASRSLRQGITASEHGQALKLAESQLESLKFRQQHSAEADFLSTFATTDPNFCLDTSASDPSDSSWQPKPNSNPLTLATTGSPPPYSAVCASSSKYFMNINVRSSASNPPSYLITVRWNAIGGGTSQTQLYYRF